MIVKTSVQFDISLDPKDELAVVEFQQLLQRIIKYSGGFEMEWDAVGHRFEVTIETVDCP